MIRHALKTVSAAGVLALSTAAPAVACTQSSTAANQQAQPQVQQVHAKFANRGYHRGWRHHHHWNWQGQQQQPSSDQQAAQTQQPSSQSQSQGNNCDHNGSQSQQQS